MLDFTKGNVHVVYVIGVIDHVCCCVSRDIRRMCLNQSVWRIENQQLMRPVPARS